MTFPGGGGIIGHMQDGSVSPIGNFFRNKWVRIILATDVLAIILIVAFSINKATQTAVLSFNVAPVDATITINGNGSYKNNGEAYFFTPGTYDIQISHPSLDTKTFTADLSPDHNTTISTFLSKDNDFYFYTLRDNFSSFERLAEIASAKKNQTTDQDTSAENFIARFKRNYALYQTELPIEYMEYNFSTNGQSLEKDITVRANYDCDATLCLQALVVGTDDKKFVNSLIEEKGFNLEDVEIEYKIY